MIPPPCSRLPFAAEALLLTCLTFGCGTPAPGKDPVCGDGLAEEAEPCDGDDLAGQTCESLGLRSGRLLCTQGCALDTVACLPPTVCGDGVAEGEEACDGSDLRGQTCGSLAYYGGTLSCGPDCVYDLRSCAAAGRCGDGLLNAPVGWPEEICDDGNAEDWDGCTACQMSEIRVNEDPEDLQYPTEDRLPTVTIDPWGDVIAMWLYDHWSPWTNPPEVCTTPRLRRIGVNGALSESFFSGHASCEYELRVDPQTVTVTTDPEGNVLLVWWVCSYGERFWARWLDPEMLPLGDAFMVADGGGWCGGESYIWPINAKAVGAHEAVVLWGESSIGPAYTKRFLLNQPLTSRIEIPVPECFTDSNDQLAAGFRSDLTTTESGFLFTWSSERLENERASSVFVRGHSASGAVSGPDLVVSDELGPGAYYPRVTAWPDGRFLVTYTRLEDATELSTPFHDVFGRLFETDGTASSGELLLNSFTTGDQGQGIVPDDLNPLTIVGIPRANLCDDGSFIVFWRGQVQGAPLHTYRTHGRRFGPDGSPLGPEKLIGSEIGQEVGLVFDTRVASDSGCERFAAVASKAIPNKAILVARLNYSLDVIGAYPW